MYEQYDASKYCCNECGTDQIDLKKWPNDIID